MRGVSKPLFALVAIGLLALALSACGSDDSGDSAAATTAQEATATTAQSGSGEEGSDDSSGSSGSDDAPSGSGAGATGEGSEDFRTPGGDNSIQDFGEEPGESEIEAANTAVVGYMEARAEDDWKGQCVYLAKAAVEPLEKLASQAPQFKGRGCAAILETLLSSTPRSTRANPMTGGIASFRVEGDRGFALFHGAKGVDYFVPMVKEGDEWRVGAIGPTEFP